MPSAIGNKQVLEQCFYCLAQRGICTLVGAIPTGQKVELLAGHFYVEKQIRGCFMAPTVSMSICRGIWTCTARGG